MIGAKVSSTQRPQNVIFFIDRKPKPFHHSQLIVEENELGTTLKICVQLNFELQRIIPGMGECIKVVAPRKLK